MRCTKCSFISFDDLLTCAKCASDLSRLSKELNGTCIETRQEFFLGTAVQTTGMDDSTFSDSQMLPPIDHSDMNFDDTSTGGFSPLSSPLSDASGFDFDDSVGVAADDDVAIELGDIMPIDFEQFDSGSGLSEGILEQTDSLPSDGFNFDFDKTDSVDFSVDKEIDLDLSANFGDDDLNIKFDDDLSGIDLGNSSNDLPLVLADVDSSPDDVKLADAEDTGFDLDQELFEHLSDDSGSFDETTSLNADAGLNDTQVALVSIENDDSGSFDLDESLVAELAGVSSLDASGELQVDFSVEHSASGDFELDAALVAELASGEDGGPVGESFSAEPEGAEDLLEPVHQLTVDNEGLSFANVEDLTGDFLSIQEDDDADLSGLDLADIDVSDLVDSSDRISSEDAGLVSRALEDGFVGQPIELPASSAIEDRISAGIDNEEPVGLGQDDDVGALGGLEGGSVGVIDVMEGVGSDIDPLTEELVLPDSNLPHDFTSSFLDDTFREGDATVILAASAEEDSLEDIDGDEFVLDFGEDEGGENNSSADIDALALDTEFEAFLNKTATTDDKLPEIELIVDDDDDGPPDLPA